MTAHDVIKLDYDLAEAMARTFNDSAQKLNQVLQEVQKIAKTLEDGALLGQGGSSLSDAIRGNLSQSLGKLIDKYQALEADVRGAISDMHEADGSSASFFNG